MFSFFKYWWLPGTSGTFHQFIEEGEVFFTRMVVKTVTHVKRPKFSSSSGWPHSITSVVQFELTILSSIWTEMVTF